MVTLLTHFPGKWARHRDHPPRDSGSEPSENASYPLRKSPVQGLSLTHQSRDSAGTLTDATAAAPASDLGQALLFLLGLSFSTGKQRCGPG